MLTVLRDEERVSRRWRHLARVEFLELAQGILVLRRYVERLQDGERHHPAAVLQSGKVGHRLCGDGVRRFEKELALQLDSGGVRDAL